MGRVELAKAVLDVVCQAGLIAHDMKSGAGGQGTSEPEASGLKAKTKVPERPDTRNCR